MDEAPGQQSMFGQPPDDPILDAIRANPGIAIAGLSAGVTVAYLLIISRFQPETALTLLQSGGVVGLLIALGVTLVPIVAPTATVCLAEAAFALSISKTDGQS